jgi:competence protein ComEC
VFLGGLALFVHRSFPLIIGVVLLAAVVGIWRTQAVVGQPSVLADIAADKPTLTLSGVVDGDIVRTASGLRYPFRVMMAGDTAVSGRIMVYGPEWVRPRFGQALTLSGKLQLPKNTGDFDYVSWLAKDGIRAQMHFPEYGVPDGIAVPLSICLQRPLFSVRDALGEAIARAVPEPESSYLGGVVLGTRGSIEPSLTDAFSRTGTSHILAISGYNITIVAGALMAGLARLGRRRAYGATVIGITLFTLMVGASASVVRAALMGMLGLTAVQLGRRAEAGTGMLLTAALMTAANPMVLRWDAGFQLSFLAVAGIVYLEPLLRPGLARLVRWEPLAQMMSTTLAAQLAVLPLILFQFGTLAVYALPVNMLVLPLVPVAMTLGFATGVAGVMLPFFGSLVGQLAWLVAAVQLGIIRFASELPYASLELRIDTATTLALYATLVAFVVSVYHGHSEPPKERSND